MFQGIQTNDQTFCQNCNPAKTFMEEEEDLLTQKLGDIFLVRTALSIIALENSVTCTVRIICQ